MGRQPKVTFIQEPNMYKSKLEQVTSFLDKCEHELADEQTYYKILTEREDFINWLKNKDLLYLMDNPTKHKSREHWTDYLTVLNLFIRFDLLMAQCPCPMFDLDESLYRDERRFKSLMTELN